MYCCVLDCAGHDHVVGTRGSGIVSRAADTLAMRRVESRIACVVVGPGLVDVCVPRSMEGGDSNLQILTELPVVLLYIIPITTVSVVLVSTCSKTYGRNGATPIFRSFFT